jgi:hypothetical protein
MSGVACPHQNPLSDFFHIFSDYFPDLSQNSLSKHRFFPASPRIFLRFFSFSFVCRILSQKYLLSCVLSVAEPPYVQQVLTYALYDPNPVLGVKKVLLKDVAEGNVSLEVDIFRKNRLFVGSGMIVIQRDAMATMATILIPAFADSFGFDTVCQHQMRRFVSQNPRIVYLIFYVITTQIQPAQSPSPLSWKKCLSSSSISRTGRCSARPATRRSPTRSLSSPSPR